MKGVFDIKRESGYDDAIAERYHFPPQYQQVAERLVGDWILYRETQRNAGRKAYVAVARVLKIAPDPVTPDHAYAIIGDFKTFDRPVPLVDHGRYAEAPLRELPNPARAGAYLQGRSIVSGAQTPLNC